VAAVAGTLQGAMAVVFWTGAVTAAAAFVVALAFPHIEIAAPRAAAGGAPAARDQPADG
jgi:hypothetical protein